MQSTAKKGIDLNSTAKNQIDLNSTAKKKDEYKVVREKENCRVTGLVTEYKIVKNKI